MAAIEEIFKALGDPTRIRIVEMLATNGETCVCKIMEEMNMSQPAVSHHLSTLKHSGLVLARKQGQWVYYSLCCPTISEVVLPLIQKLLGKADVTPVVTCGCR